MIFGPPGRDDVVVVEGAFWIAGRRGADAAAVGEADDGPAVAFALALGAALPTTFLFVGFGCTTFGLDGRKPLLS